jgi:hypothetical protein
MEDYASGKDESDKISKGTCVARPLLAIAEERTLEEYEIGGRQPQSVETPDRAGREPDEIRAMNMGEDEARSG